MNIFVLCGAHDGSLVSRIDEVTAQGLYGEGVKWDYIHLLEPQPAHSTSLQKVSQQDSRCIYSPIAVSTSDGTAEFYVKGGFGNCSSTLDSFKHTGHLKQRIEVVTVDFLKWIENNTSTEDFVVIDMDIECEEYNILPALIQSEVSNRINFISVEFHRGKSSYWNKDNRDLSIELEVVDFFKDRFLDHDTYFAG